MLALTIETFRDKRGAWRWRAKATNGHIVAEGGQGYTRRVDLERSRDRFLSAVRRDEYALREPE